MEAGRRHRRDGFDTDFEGWKILQMRCSQAGREKKEHLPNFTERKEKHVPDKGKVCVQAWKDEKEM